MSYVQGFVIPVATGKRDAYLAMAQMAAPLFLEYGASRVVECWGDDVPHGTLTDFYRAVAAEEGETIVFSWIVWPDHATAKAAETTMMEDERMKPPEDMPFDGKRLIYAGFDEIYDGGQGGPFGYIDGFLAAVPIASKEAYLDHARTMTAIIAENGCTRGTENWAEDIAEGKVTDFRRAVQLEPGEAVVFSWLEWPDKATRNAGMGKMMEDPRVHALDMPFDGKRMIYGGFVPILDTAN